MITLFKKWFATLFPMYGFKKNPNSIYYGPYKKINEIAPEEKNMLNQSIKIVPLASFKEHTEFDTHILEYNKTENEYYSWVYMLPRKGPKIPRWSRLKFTFNNLEDFSSDFYSEDFYN